ncbi:hypothetical protein [Saccharicrinis sp. FJH54]|uniref:hypothetical protein n=1 Tax=Saccharicrinis sp. FJH54 TaxID=3344665 RepID=UPI0035D4980E
MWLKKIIKNRRKISFTLAVLTLLYFFFTLDEFKRKNCEHVYNAFLESEITGVVIKKYIDYKNHSFPVIDIKSNGSVYSFSLPMDRSGFYEFIFKGDTINKDKYDNKIIVKNPEMDTCFIIKNFCDSLN